VKWRTSEGKHSKDYYYKRTILSLEETLWKPSSAHRKRQFLPKTYEYPISFNVPDKLLPSIETTHPSGSNKVSYRLKVYADQENWYLTSFSCFSL
jgi:hypothetical protein